MACLLLRPPAKKYNALRLCVPSVGEEKNFLNLLFHYWEPRVLLAEGQGITVSKERGRVH